MKVMVNGFACDGHHQCVAIAKDFFRIGSDNKAYAASTKAPTELESAIREAAVMCPMHAIMVLEEPA
jgi:ferredoxin